MNIAKLTTILSFAAALSAAAPALTFASTDGTEDGTGVATLGVDISAAGTTAGSIHQFLASLAPDTRRAVLGGCDTAIANAGQATPNVVNFCDAALANGSSMDKLAHNSRIN